MRRLCLGILVGNKKNDVVQMVVQKIARTDEELIMLRVGRRNKRVTPPGNSENGFPKGQKC